MKYCLTLGEWFTLWGAIASTVAIIVAMWIVFYQERKEKRRREREYRDIGKTLCLLIKQLHSFVNLQIDKGYGDCYKRLENNILSIPKLQIVPLDAVKKLDKLSPELIYRVLMYHGFTGDECNKFIILVACICSGFELGIENYRMTESRVVNLMNKYNDELIDFRLFIGKYLKQIENHDFDKDHDFSEKINTELNIYCEKLDNDEVINRVGNIRHSMENLVDKIREIIIVKDKKNINDIEIMSMIGSLKGICQTIEDCNGKYMNYLDNSSKGILEDMKSLEKLGRKLNEGKMYYEDKRGNG